VLRWLLSLIAAMTLLGSAMTAWAAAGIQGDSTCCCPDQAKCKCLEDDGKPGEAPTLKRCGGQADWVDPGVVPAIPLAAAPRISDVAVALIATVDREPIPDSRTLEPETPPF
jgi:hypothetical protein